MQNRELLIEEIRRNALKFENGQWWTLREDVRYDTRSFYDPETQHEEVQEVLCRVLVRDKNLSEFADDEWFQLEVVNKDVTNIQNIRNLSAAVWKNALQKDCLYIRFIKQQTAEMQAFAKNLSVDSIRFFTPMYEEDAKLFMQQEGIFVKKDSNGWSFYRRTKLGNDERMCSVPLEKYNDKCFFFINSLPRNKDLVSNIVDLAERNDKNAFDFVKTHLDENLFRKCILKLAKRGDNGALEVVLNNDDKREFLLYIIELSKNSEQMKQIVFRHPEEDACWRYILELAEQNHEGAIQVIFDNFEKGGYALDSIVNLAHKGNSKAEQIALQHPEDGDCWNYILELADQNDERVKSIILNNFSRNDLKYIAKYATMGDSEAIEIALGYPEDEYCWSFILKLAKQCDQRAKQIVMSDISKDGVLDCVAIYAVQGDSEAARIAFQHLENENCCCCVKELVRKGDETLRKALFDNLDDDRYFKCILELAKDGDLDAENAVIENAEKNHRLKNVVELAESGNKKARSFLSPLRQLIILSERGVLCDGRKLQQYKDFDGSCRERILQLKKIMK